MVQSTLGSSKKMTNEIKSIAIDRFEPHPDNPNRMSKANFRKLVRNIERTGRYEPLVVRPYPHEPDMKFSPRTCGGGDAGRGVTPSVSARPRADGGSLKGKAFGDGKQQDGHPQAALEAATRPESPCVSVFQIINGHHRWQALKELGYKTADAIVWDIDDEQTDILLATLNRLGGSDILDKKLTLLKRLNKRMQTGELAKLLPQTKKQIERLTSMFSPPLYAGGNNPRINLGATPMVFFLNDEQSAVVADAIFLACLAVAGTATDPTVNCGAKRPADGSLSSAAKRAAGLEKIARFFLSFSQSTAK